VAGAASKVLVSGFGERMLGSSFTCGVEGSGLLIGRGPVRTLEGKICSKPCEAATASIDLKY